MATSSISISPAVPKLNPHVQDVMALIGWNEKAFVPIANEENRTLMDAIRVLEHDKQKKSGIQEQLGERVIWLKQHVENSQGDIQRNLVLIFLFDIYGAILLI